MQKGIPKQEFQVQEPNEKGSKKEEPSLLIYLFFLNVTQENQVEFAGTVVVAEVEALCEVNELKASEGVETIFANWVFGFLEIDSKIEHPS